MNKLIKYFNENYGEEYGKISYPRTTIQIYKVYQIIKSYGIKDDKLVELLHNVRLPSPKSVEEKEMYSECIYEIGAKTLPKLSELENDLYYKKEESFLKLTKNDFFYDEDTMTYRYKQSPKLNWLKTIEDTYSIKINTFIEDLGEDGAENILIEELDPDCFDKCTENIIVIDMYEMVICNNGFLNLKEGDRCFEQDSFNVQIRERAFEQMSSFRMDFLKIETKTIPKECLPLDDIIFKNLNVTNSVSMNRKEDTPIGARSIALGNYTTASGMYSYAEGDSTIAKGYASHAEGCSTTAKGRNSHAEGSSTIAKSSSSHVEGYGTIANGESTHVQGRFNIEDTEKKYAHIVGNGEMIDSNLQNARRSNAHTLDWNGNGWYAGKLSQEGTPTEDKDLVTKKYVDTNNNRLLTSIYGKRYNFQINEDDFNSLYNLLYGHEHDSMEINLNSVSIDGINEILKGDVWYDAVSFNNAIILNVGATGSNGITLFMKDENLRGEICYISFTLNINESNIPVFSYHEFKGYNINDELFNPGIFNNEFSLLDKNTNMSL